MSTPGPESQSHPVLIEVTRTHLVWVHADSPEHALDDAAKRQQELLHAPLATAVVDASTEVAALTEDTAAWLDLDGDQYERIDRYFGATRTGDAW